MSLGVSIQSLSAFPVQQEMESCFLKEADAQQGDSVFIPFSCLYRRRVQR